MRSEPKLSRQVQGDGVGVVGIRAIGDDHGSQLRRNRDQIGHHRLLLGELRHHQDARGNAQLALGGEKHLEPLGQAGDRIGAADHVGQGGGIIDALFDAHDDHDGPGLIEDVIDGRHQGASVTQTSRIAALACNQHGLVERELLGIGIGGGAHQANDRGAHGANGARAGVDLDNLDAVEKLLRHDQEPPLMSATASTKAASSWAFAAPRTVWIWVSMSSASSGMAVIAAPASASSAPIRSAIWR